MIPTDEYIKYIGQMPVLCVDLVIRNSHGEYFLVRRANEPKKDHWWPVGGRVLKGETLDQAARRKIHEETSLRIKDLQPVGFFETVSDRHPFGLDGKYHAVSVVFAAEVDGHEPIILDGQSTEWKFSKELPPDFKIHSFETMQQPAIRSDRSSSQNIKEDE
jgi:colanic acid biosynthesis protein WcaH